jgi:hypothetical protein
MSIRRLAVYSMIPVILALSGCGKKGTKATAEGPIRDGILCGGSQTMDYEKETFDVATGPAILAGGSCNITLTDCQITAHAPGFGMGAVVAGGSANVTIVNTTVKGSPALTGGGSATVDIRGGSLEGDVAVDVGGSAHVKASGVAVHGKVNRGGSAVLTGLAR